MGVCATRLTKSVMCSKPLYYQSDIDRKIVKFKPIVLRVTNIKFNAGERCILPAVLDSVVISILEESDFITRMIVLIFKKLMQV